jgi:hypothetical protein
LPVWGGFIRINSIPKPGLTFCQGMSKSLTKEADHGTYYASNLYARAHACLHQQSGSRFDPLPSLQFL